MMITIKQLIVLLIIGLLAGFIAGTMGVGGAIIIVPCLVFFLGLSQHMAQGTSLTVLLFPAAFFAVLNYAKNGYVNFKFAAILIVAFVIGSYLGSIASVNLPEKVLQKGFACLLLVVGLKMLIGK